MRALFTLSVVLAFCQAVPGRDDKPDEKNPDAESQERVEVNLVTPPPKGTVVFGLSGKDVDDSNHANLTGKTKERNQLVKTGGVWVGDGPVPALVEIPSLKTEFADYAYVRLYDGPTRRKLVAVEKRAVGTEKVVLLVDVYRKAPSPTNPNAKPITFHPTPAAAPAADSRS